MDERTLAVISLKLKASVIFAISSLAYCGVAAAPFLHDDKPAILNNPDVQEKSNVLQLFRHDFWGTNILSNKSHKSYRPVTVLVFRLLHMMWQNWSLPYHTTNIVLHSIVSVLFYFVCRKIVFCAFKETASLVAGLLFALHPIHTEAVCGVVGCAELLSALFFMTGLLLYCETPSQRPVSCGATQRSFYTIQQNNKEKSAHTNLRRRKARLIDETDESKNAMISYHQQDSHHTRTKRENYVSSAATTFLSWCFALMGMLSKESGITVLGVAIIFYITKSYKNRFFTSFNKLFVKVFATLTWGLLLILLRMWIMGWRQPQFAKSDNPTAHEKELFTRFFTHLYIYWCNIRLLFIPVNLCYDYSSQTIPLITSLWDARILCLPFLCIGCGIIVWLFEKKAQHESFFKAFVMGFSLLTISFLPASNLFFPVGFVIAERVLYLPSAGFIIMLVTFWTQALLLLPSLQRILKLCMLVTLLLYLLQTVQRCNDWTSKEKLFRAGVKVAPNNSKIRYNWANYLRETNSLKEAAVEYEKVLEIDPTYVSAINNLATILEDNKKTEKRAEALYARAIQIEPAHENAYSNLAKIMMKQNRYEDATKVLIRATQRVSGSLFHVTSLANILIKRDKITEAENVLHPLLRRNCMESEFTISKSCPPSYFPAVRAYANLQLKRGNVDDSVRIFVQLQQLNYSDYETSVGFSKALIASGKVDEATEMLIKIHQQHNPHATEHVWRSAAEMFQAKRYQQSKRLYESYIATNPHNIEAMGQYGALLFQLGNRQRGKRILLNITSTDNECAMSGMWRNLATIYGVEKQHKKAMNLLNQCIIRSKKTEINDNWKKHQALTVHELAKHKIDYSKQLFNSENGKKLIILRSAMKDLEKVLTLEPTNSEAKAAMKNLKIRLQQMT